MTSRRASTGAGGHAPQVPDLDIAAIVRVLEAHGVEFVVIGGAAAIVRDLPADTKPSPWLRPVPLRQGPIIAHRRDDRPSRTKMGR